MKKTFVLGTVLAMALSGCFFVSKKPAQSSQNSTAGEPKNHGQARKAEVHERNEEKKEAKEADKK